MEKVKKMKYKNKVIIWGSDNSNMLGVLRQLSENGWNCFVLFHHRTARIAVKSRYCTDYYIAKSLDDGISFLLANFAEEEVKPIVLCTGDSFVEELDKHRERLAERYYIPGTRKQGELSRVLNKYKQVELAAEVGMKVPSSILVDNANEIDFASISYPCIVKPNQRIAGVQYKFKIRICRNEEELRNSLDGSDARASYIIQEYIENYQLVVIDGSRLSCGETFISGALYCEKGGEQGDSSFGYVTEQIPSAIDVRKAIAYLEKIGYCGPFGFDFGLTGGKAYFFESNLRIDATNYLFYQMGFNFLHLWVAEITGTEWKDISREVKGKKYFVDDIGELSMVASGEIDKKQWQDDMEKAEIYKFKNSKDNKPYICQRLVYALLPVYDRIKKILRK